MQYFLGLLAAVMLAFAFLVWFNDPSYVAEREAEAYRKVEAEYRRAELSAQWEPVITAAWNIALVVVVLSGGMAGAAAAVILAYSLWRRTNTWRIDPRTGTVPLTDAQVQLIALTLAQNYHPVLLAQAQHPQLTDNRTQVVQLGSTTPAALPAPMQPEALCI